MKVDVPPPDLSGQSLGERIAKFRENYQAWVEDIRKDPALFFSPMPVRIATWIIGAIIILILVRVGVATFAPTKAGTEFEAATAEASIMVACTNRGCNKTYMAHPEIGFKDWPMTCTTCANPTVYRATLCRSCRTWFARPPGSAPGCPFCDERAAQEKAARQAASKPTTRSKDKHDEDDGW